MHLDLHDTIVALSSAAGPGNRAIVRLSGSRAVEIVQQFFRPTDVLDPLKRRWHGGELRLPDLHSPLPAEVYVWPAPRTYTGQQLVEIHTLSSPPLVELLIAACLAAGARAAQPGEFTLRAFLAGKLDLTRAEAVLGVIEAAHPDELKQALGQLAGNVARPLQELREDLLNLLADVEAALDFSEEDLRFVGQEELLTRLGRGLALLTNIGRQIDRRGVSEAPFRVVLAGQPNVGKSSLFNALGRASALVSHEPGTTRDYLVQRLEIEEVRIDLVDTAGWQMSVNGIEGQAQELGREQQDKADLVLLCVEAGQPIDERHRQLIEAAGAKVVLVATKCDLAEPPPDQLATSARTQEGLKELRQLLLERARAQARPALAPSLSRCRGHVTLGLEHLRRAHALVLEQDPPELLALELRGALEQLGEMVGAVYTDDLLDRIFSRFCIGK